MTLPDLIKKWEAKRDEWQAKERRYRNEGNKHDATIYYNDWTLLNSCLEDLKKLEGER